MREKRSSRNADGGGSGVADGTSDDGAGRQFIEALARGLDVLQAFQVNDPPLSNQELSRRTGLPRPTISRITYTLTEIGCLSYHEHSGCYELGGAILALGHVAQENFDVIKKIKPAMQRLADFAGANVGLATRDKLNMVYLERCQGASHVGLRMNVGGRVPITVTSVGRAYLAGATPAEVSSLMQQLKRRYKDNPDEPLRSLEIARSDMNKYGFCISAGEWQSDIHAVAVSLRVPQFGGLLAINCGGPAYLMPKRKLIDKIGPELICTVREISGILGNVQPMNNSEAAPKARVRPRRKPAPPGGK